MKGGDTVSKTTAWALAPRQSGYLIMGLSGFLGGLSLMLFGAFLFSGLPSLLQLGLQDAPSLFIDALLCLSFFLQHSLMVRNGFRKWLKAYIPTAYHGAVFSIFSGIFLVLIMLLWQKTAVVHVEFNGAAFWFMRSLFLLAIVGFYITSRALKYFDPFGIRDILTYLKGKTIKESAFIVRGTYQWVRHPFYAFFLVLIWTPVSVTTDRLLFNILWTGWIIIGTMLEERDLIALFGIAYRNYQRNVPMLIPFKRLCRKNGQL